MFGCAAAEGPHHYPSYKPFLMASWDADELKGYKEEGTCCRTFSILKDTAIKLHFQAVWFYLLLQCGDSEAMGGSFSRHFLLLLTTHWEWKAECLSQLCICNGLQWIWAEQMHMIRAELVMQTWSESKITHENAQVYKKIMLFLPASSSLQTDRHLIYCCCIIKAWCTNMFENAGHSFQINEILVGIWENIHKSQ